MGSPALLIQDDPWKKQKATGYDRGEDNNQFSEIKRPRAMEFAGGRFVRSFSGLTCKQAHSADAMRKTAHGRALSLL